jgi:hypothetical protein
MHVNIKINEYLDSQLEPKRSEMHELHNIILKIAPESKLWFFDGKNSDGKIVSNPNIGYGFQTIKYANGKTKDFYQVGISANKTGISIYIIGFSDKEYLAKTYREKIGKASVSGYCIKLKNLKDIHLKILKTAIKDGFEAPI